MSPAVLQGGDGCHVYRSLGDGCKPSGAGAHRRAPPPLPTHICHVSFLCTNPQGTLCPCTLPQFPLSTSHGCHGYFCMCVPMPVLPAECQLSECRRFVSPLLGAQHLEQCMVCSGFSIKKYIFEGMNKSSTKMLHLEANID